MKLGAVCMAGVGVAALYAWFTAAAPGATVEATTEATVDATTEASLDATAAPDAESPPRDLDELRAQISRVLLREHVPGAGIALIDADRVIWSGGVGVADRATGRPVTADTLFRVASITKSFVALALVKLAEQGRVDLRAPVARLAPELAIGNRWAAEQPITVAHLLEHTAGFDDAHPNEWAAPLAGEAMPLRDALALNPASRVARWRPGTRFSYSNPGYTVAGYVIEKVTGLPFEEALRREVLRPLGMTGAALRWSPEVDARMARGYDRDGALEPYRPNYHRPAGNLMASPRELAALVQLALGRGRYRGRQVISPAGMARIERSETLPLDAGDASYGLGNGGDVSEAAPIRGHNGGLPGFRSTYGYLPGQGVGYVVLINSTQSPMALRAIRHLVVQYLLRDARLPPPPRRGVPEAELRRWVGAYHNAAPRYQLLAFLDRIQPGLELFVERGALYARALPGRGPAVELVPVGGDLFRAPAASAGHLRFGVDRDGRRVLVTGGSHLVEEPRARTLGFALVPRICVWLLATGLVLPLGALRRRVGPSPGVGWPFATALPLFALPHLLGAADGQYILGEANAYTVGIFALTLVFALGSAASLVQALVWLVRPGPVVRRLYRLGFGLAACAATAYLAAYGVIGIQLWRY